MSVKWVVLFGVAILTPLIACLFWLWIRSNDTVSMVRTKIEPAVRLRDKAAIAPDDRLEREKEQLVSDLLTDRPTPTVLEKAASVPTPAQEALSDVDLLSERTDAWRYRSYIEIGDTKYGRLEDMATGDIIKVTEGQNYGGVLFDSITSEYCVATVGDASRVLTLEYVPDTPTETPAVDSEAYRLFSAYREKTEPKMREMYRQYLPKNPTSPLRTPPAPEELEDAVAAFYATVRPTIEAGGTIPDFEEGPEPSEGMSEFEEWVDTYRSVWKDTHE